MLDNKGCLEASHMHMYQNNEEPRLIIAVSNLFLSTTIQGPRATSCTINVAAKSMFFEEEVQASKELKAHTVGPKAHHSSFDDDQLM